MKRYLWLPAIASLVGFAACSDDDAEKFAGVVDYDDFPDSAKGADRSEDLGVAHAIVLSAGFANGQAVQYLDQGDLNPTPAKMYIIVHDGAPVEGQYPIIDTLPDDADYSTFWQVVEVEAGHGYKANDIKSVAGLKGLKQTETLEAVHCPIVNPDATWFAADLSQTFLVFWGTGEEIPNPYFDPSADVDDVNKPTLTDADATPSDIVLTPVWQKRMRAFCWSEDFSKRFPLVDDEGAISLDLGAAAMRYDTYDVGFAPGGELDISPSGFLPVFDQNLGDAGYSPIILQAYVASPGSQPGSTADLDADEVASAEPNALLDNAIVFPLALERFRVTVENTTEGDDGHAFSAGYAIVEDGSSPIFGEGAPASTALAELAASGDVGPLLAGWPVSGRPLSPILDAAVVPPVAPGESASVIVLAAPFVPYLSYVAALDGVEGVFTGASELALYDQEFAAVPTQTADLMAFVTDAEAENPDDPETPLVVVGPAPGIEGPVGTITVELIAPAGGNP